MTSKELQIHGLIGDRMKNIIKRFFRLKLTRKSRIYWKESKEGNSQGIQKSKNILALSLTFCLILFSFFGAALMQPLVVSALPAFLYKPITIGSLILSLMTGSGTATIPTGTIGSGSNIADVAMQLDTEAFSIGSLIDEGVVTISDAGYVQSWDPTAFEGILTDQGLSTAYQAAQVDDYLKAAVSTGAEVAPFSGNLVLALLAQHIVDRNNQIVAINKQIMSEEEFNEWYANFQEDSGDPLYEGLKWIDEKTSKIFNFDNFKNAFISLFGSKIDKGVSISAKTDYMPYKYNCYAQNSSGVVVLVYSSQGPCAFYKNNSNSYNIITFGSYSGFNYQYKWNDENRVRTYNSSAYSDSSLRLNATLNFIGAPVFEDQEQAKNYVYSAYVENVNVYSPDVINQNGNWQGTEQPTTLQDGEEIMPIGAQDYQQWAEQAQGLTNQGNYDENGGLFTQFADPFISPVSENPNVVFPAPDVITPDYNSGAVTPNQPVIPDKPSLEDGQQDETLGAAATGLQDVFPFCIPFDVVDFFKLFSTQERQAPHLVYPFQSELFGFHEEIDIDFSMFDDVAALVRNLELILFIIGLALSTRSIIGAGG